MVEISATPGTPRPTPAAELQLRGAVQIFGPGWDQVEITATSQHATLTVRARDADDMLALLRSVLTQLEQRYVVE